MRKSETDRKKERGESVYRLLFYSFGNEVAKRIANKIVAEFPSEVSSTYYISPIKKKDSVLKKSIPARGKIISMWRNRSFANKKLENVMTEAASIHSDINGEIFKKNYF